MNNENIVQKIWNLCNILRGDGISYHEYISELTYLLFLKIAQENKTEDLLPEDCRWSRLVDYTGDDLLTEYRDMLTYLGGHASSDIVKRIYAFPTTVFSHSENLKAVVDGIAKLDWHSISMDGMGDIYEGLLAKNSQDARSGAGQYFTPRALVDSMVRIMKPELGEVIQDPATGTGGFLISADHYIRSNNSREAYIDNPPKYEGVEIEKGTYRICLMNAFLHQLDSNIILGDALTKDAEALSLATVILANPPFGAKAGSARKNREDILTTNKQLAFLQHIYSGLQAGGRAAVVLPDNVLFEEGVGRKIRQELMDKCNLHTILRLPTGIFYSQGVKTNVLFFTRGSEDTGNTKIVWIYDMRSGAVKFGKKRPLNDSDFSDFEHFFGTDPKGMTNRETVEGNNRWKAFSRQEILNRNDNLDIVWLANADFDLEDNLSEPEEIAEAILNHLREALNEIKELSIELDSDSLETP
ncbi:N-6 DNA methylase [Dyadobacter sp. 32]|uniref:class I SAM-dependent DNA methyltransferase n=1 Tax=Dyadobacter sp. 32 TaxID=538966 RepID=UPI0011ED4927